MYQVDNDRLVFENAIAVDASERARLIRLCARITGRSDIAEDLVQETLLAAWRSSATLRNPAARAQWLSGIARNVCKRWAERDVPRQYGSKFANQIPLDALNVDTWLADDFDLDSELDRQELVDLLDRALRYLPLQTRNVLVQHYIDESPQAEIAQRLGMRENAVSMRLHRGRLLLRRVLTEELSEEFAAFDLSHTETQGWRETHIWCPTCGRGRLLARLPQHGSVVTFRCPACAPDPVMIGWRYPLANASVARLIGTARRPKTLMKKMSSWAHSYFRPALGVGKTTCSHCNAPAVLRYFTEVETDGIHAGAPGVYVLCDACGEAVSSSLDGLVLALPHLQRFWHAHPRIRTLPTREVETYGQAALVARIESVTDGAYVDVVVARDSLQALYIADVPHTREM